MPQIIQITSEAIQAQIRRLLPSQQGFGIDMEASSVITPIIDVTPAAEGSQLPVSLQQAINLDGATEIDVENTTTDYNLAPGFWRLTVTSCIQTSSTISQINTLSINDGTTQKVVYGESHRSGGINGEYITTPIDLVIFLKTGDFLRVATGNNNCRVLGSVRQVASVNGELINPVGFSFE